MLPCILLDALVGASTEVKAGNCPKYLGSGTLCWLGQVETRGQNLLTVLSGSAAGGAQRRTNCRNSARCRGGGRQLAARAR